jgi:hypothetical protein
VFSSFFPYAAHIPHISVDKSMQTHEKRTLARNLVNDERIMNRRRGDYEKYMSSRMLPTHNLD